MGMDVEKGREMKLRAHVPAKKSGDPTAAGQD
jgi:hypothetical protein